VHAFARINPKHQEHIGDTLAIDAGHLLARHAHRRRGVVDGRLPQLVDPFGAQCIHALDHTTVNADDNTLRA